MADNKRHCRIVGAAIEDRNGAGDGAYGLFDVEGSPEKIGQEIGEALAECDMMRGPSWAYIEDGDGELYLCLRIKVARHPVAFDDEEDDDNSGRGDGSRFAGEGHIPNDDSCRCEGRCEG